MYNSHRFKSTLAPLDVWNLNVIVFLKQLQLGPNFSGNGCFFFMFNISLRLFPSLRSATNTIDLLSKNICVSLQAFYFESNLFENMKCYTTKILEST